MGNVGSAMTSESLLALNKFREQLQGLHEQQQSTGDHKKAEVRFDRWRGQVNQWLTDNFGADELSRFENAIQPNQVANSEGDWCRMQMRGADSFIDSLIDDIETDSGGFNLPAGENVQQDVEAAPIAAAVEQGRKVFVVHGHDEEAKLAVTHFLERLGLEPIILHEQTDEGRTVIEKFSDHAGEVRYAVVLLTPDDIGGAASVGNIKKLQQRARQNVILELGFFMGTLGRKHVCALMRGDIEIPSDYAGVIYKSYDETGAWKLELAKEIKAAGIDIDMNDAA